MASPGDAVAGKLAKLVAPSGKRPALALVALAAAVGPKPKAAPGAGA